MPAWLTWLITWIEAAPLEASVCAAAGLFAVVAIVMAVKVARELSALLHETDQAREDWCDEFYGAHRW